MALRRREFLKAGLTIAGAVALRPTFWERAFGAPAAPGPSPYGPLQAPDANGLMLPAGFTSRVIARSGLPVIPAPYIWPIFPDGAACFPAGDGGWDYVVNSETPSHGALPDGIQHVGGVSAIHFDAEGNITDAYSVLNGTRTNCAGGPTPWGTWLSCEEFDDGDDGGATASAGHVWECDPTGKAEAIRRDALGAFQHEAAAVDPATHQVYLTEDQGDGRSIVSRPRPSPARRRISTRERSRRHNCSARRADRGTSRGRRSPTRLRRRSRRASRSSRRRRSAAAKAASTTTASCISRPKATTRCGVTTSRARRWTSSTTSPTRRTRGTPS